MVRMLQNLNNWIVCYVVQNSLSLEMGQKIRQKYSFFPSPSETENCFLAYAERGKPNRIAQHPIIQVLPVLEASTSEDETEIN